MQVPCCAPGVAACSSASLETVTTFAHVTPAVPTLWLQIGADGTPAQTPPIMLSARQPETWGSVSSPPQPSCRSIPTAATDPSKVLMYAPSDDSWTRSPN